MKNFTTLSFLFLICFVAACAGSRNAIARFQLNDKEIEELDLEVDDRTSNHLEEEEDNRKNAIIVEDEPSRSPTSSTPQDAAGFINPDKAPTSVFEFIKEAIYGIFTGIYHRIFG